MSDAPDWLTDLAEESLAEVSEVPGEMLVVTSGRLVACDPLVFLRGAEPFAREVPAGRYRIRIGKLEAQNAYAKVQFAKGKVASWEVARCPGEEDVEGWPGFGVDSGLACFVDLEAVERFLEEEDAAAERASAKVAAEGIDPGDLLAYQEAFEKHRTEDEPDPLMDLETGLARSPSVATKLTKRSDANLVAFRSSPLDAVFASFWGLSARGKVVCLVTDFGVVEPEEEGDLEDDDDDDFDLSGDGGLADILSGELSGDLKGLEALAAALGGGSSEPEPEERQGPSALFLQAKGILTRWVEAEKIELEPNADIDRFAEAFLEKLASIQGQRNPGVHIGAWLLDRREVADVFASDDEIEADLRG